MKTMDDVNMFYYNFAKLPFNGDSESLKEGIFKKILLNNLLYKFIAFNDDSSLNKIKIDCLKKQLLWYAAHYTLLDESEFEIKANTFEVARKTNNTTKYIQELLHIYRELMDVCCMTDSIRDNMWQRYANDHQGICCVFSILNYDKLNPVIYTNKEEADFSKELITSLNWKGNPLECVALKRLTTMPFVLKDKSIYGCEQEIRLLCGDVYDSEYGEMGGRIAKGKKKLIGYQGTYYEYKHSGLKLEKIIIGNKLKKEYREEILQLGLPVSEE